MTWLFAGVEASIVATVIALWAPNAVSGPRRRYALWAVPLAALTGAGSGAAARQPAEAVLLSLVAGAASVMILVDVREHRLPDTIVLPCLSFWLIGVVATAVSGLAPWAAVLDSVLATAALFACFLLAAALAGGMLGFGDVKLSALLGAVLGWFGWPAVGVGMAIGILLHGVAALVVLAATRNLKADVPMGPALILGAAVGVASATVGLPW